MKDNWIAAAYIITIMFIFFLVFNRVADPQFFEAMIFGVLIHAAWLSFPKK